MNDFAANLEAVEQKIRLACQRVGRARNEVTLVAVSKLQPPEAIRALYELGHRHFGENYAQELRDKHQALGTDGREIVWHAIGPVQPKNAKYIARSAHLFHALDRLDVASELSRRREGSPLRCLIEINVAGEASKAGLTPEMLPEFLKAISTLPNLKIVGLTVMPPLVEDAELNRPHFQALAKLAQTHQLPELSMGSTSDFQVAIEEGATLVRVGTALFGERPGPH